MNKKFVFYISGHGFGHSTRMNALIKELYNYYPEIEIFIRSNAPEWIFRDSLKFDFKYHYLLADTGTYQLDFIHLDKKESFLKYDGLIKQRNSYLPDEIKFIKDNHIDIIVGDIPPSAFFIAHSCGVKSIAVSNFSWDWIFSPYLDEYPQFKYIIEDMQKGYSYADTLLMLPFSGDFPAFKQIINIPLIVRFPEKEPDILRHSLKIENELRPIILCSFGGFKINNFDFLSMSKKNTDFFFISFGNEFIRDSNFLILPFRSEYDHPSLVQLADIVVSKLGYGTVAECVSTSTPLMYISRDDFREYPVLQEGIKKNIPSYLIQKEDFFSGNWNTHLSNFIGQIPKKNLYSAMDCSGSSKAAKIIYEF